MWLVFESWSLLLYFDLILRIRRFGGLYQMVSAIPVHAQRHQLHSIETLVNAIDYAGLFYFKRIHCLQRSSATTMLLRRYGRCAEMVIGVQILPFKSHAWVELDGIVINDKLSVVERYRVIQRTQAV